MCMYSVVVCVTSGLGVWFLVRGTRPHDAVHVFQHLHHLCGDNVWVWGRRLLHWSSSPQLLSPGQPFLLDPSLPFQQDLIQLMKKQGEMLLLQEVQRVLEFCPTSLGKAATFQPQFVEEVQPNRDSSGADTVHPCQGGMFLLFQLLQQGVAFWTCCFEGWRFLRRSWLEGSPSSSSSPITLEAPLRPVTLIVWEIAIWHFSKNWRIQQIEKLNRNCGSCLCIYREMLASLAWIRLSANHWICCWFYRKPVASLGWVRFSANRKLETLRQSIMWVKNAKKLIMGLLISQTPLFWAKILQKC